MDFPQHSAHVIAIKSDSDEAFIFVSGNESSVALISVPLYCFICRNRRVVDQEDMYRDVFTLVVTHEV